MTQGTDPACDGWDNSECEGTPYCPPRCPRYVDPEGAAYVVRPFEPADRDALVEMYGTIDPESRTRGLPPTSRSGIESWLDGLTDRGWNLLARRNGRIVGHVGVVPGDADEPKFVVFVRDDHQGRGLGTELVRHTIAYAADRDYDALRLSVSRGNRRAVRVYENVGFEFDGEGDRFTTDDLDLDMRLSLSAPVADRVRLPPAER
ncbi:GNAT family N-acetyltransferase [Halobaculum sp. EA56]|uniref:GNAT family N-acetyltransferase n=1 Tax=Halobaculum sp. EA56 TaxID=3421648 RepID=UPI003EBF0EAB